MAMIIDIKNAVKKAICDKDNTVNFSFNKITAAQYPYIFFSIPCFKIDKAADEYNYSKLNLTCILEYMKEENNSQEDLWAYTDLMTEAFSSFDLLDTKAKAKNISFTTAGDILQMNFELELYIKKEDSADFMEEIEFTIH